MSGRQLILDLPAVARQGRDDFLPDACNAAALDAVTRWRDWPSGTLLLVGPPGSGRSHLAAIWRTEADAEASTGAALAQVLPALLTATRPVAVDDADAVAGDAASEEALFHMLNRTHAAHRPLLLTAHETPGTWGIALPDLESRLLALPVARLDRPSDRLLEMALVKMADDRQLALPPEVLAFLLPRMPRSLDSAGRLVAALDHAAVTRGRPLTRKLAGRVLSALDGAAADR